MHKVHFHVKQSYICRFLRNYYLEINYLITNSTKIKKIMKARKNILSTLYNNSIKISGDIIALEKNLNTCATVIFYRII